MTDPNAAPSYRLKLPCADEAEFRDKFLQKYVARGVFVPSERPKPVGTRLKLKLEIKGGVILVSGDGMVTSVTQPGGTTKPGMTVRLTALHADSIQFSLSPGGSAAQAAAARPQPPAPAPSEAAPPKPPALTPAPPPFSPAARPPATTPAPPKAPPPPAITKPDFFDISDDDLVDYGVMAITDPAIPVPAELAAPRAAPLLAEQPAPTPPPASAPFSAPTLEPPAPAATTPAVPRIPIDRRLLVVIAAAAAVLVVATVGGLLSSRGTKAARTQALRVEEQLRLADLRLLEGRLAGAGGDSALDHLLMARGAAPDDARVASRLKLLADKFEQLGDRALARKNPREAAVHFKAALAADPSRAKVRASLEDIEQPDPPAR